jgi:hypothetical protein
MAYIYRVFVCVCVFNVFNALAYIVYKIKMEDKNYGINL